MHSKNGRDTSLQQRSRKFVKHKKNPPIQNSHSSFSFPHPASLEGEGGGRPSFLGKWRAGNSRADYAEEERNREGRLPFTGMASALCLGIQPRVRSLRSTQSVLRPYSPRAQHQIIRTAPTYFPGSKQASFSRNKARLRRRNSYHDTMNKHETY